MSCLILCPLLAIQSFSIFACFLRPMRILSGNNFHNVFGGSPLIRGNKRNTDQWASTRHHMEGFSLHNSSLIGRKNQAKFENDCISRGGHRIKIAQPNLMILVSFSSAEDVLSSDVKEIYNTFCSQGTENPPFRFFFLTPGIFKSKEISVRLKGSSFLLMKNPQEL